MKRLLLLLWLVPGVAFSQAPPLEPPVPKLSVELTIILETFKTMDIRVDSLPKTLKVYNGLVTAVKKLKALEEKHQECIDDKAK